MRISILLLFLLYSFPARPTLVAFGDSITAGYALASTADGWASLYAAQRGMGLDNRAANSLTVAQEVERIRVYDGGAATALWLVCANDLYFRTPAADFAAGVQEGVDLLREKGATVLLNATCPTFPRKEEPGLVAAYDEALASVKGARMIPLPFLPPTLFSDSVHPNESGHRALAFAYLGRWRVWMPAL